MYTGAVLKVATGAASPDGVSDPLVDAYTEKAQVPAVGTAPPKAGVYGSELVFDTTIPVSQLPSAPPLVPEL